MEAYKLKVRKRVTLLSLIAILAAVLYFVLLYTRGTFMNMGEMPNFIKGFHRGAFIGIELTIAYGIYRHLRALKSEVKLKRMYINQHDERSGAILQNACLVGIGIIIIAVCLGTIVAGFFNVVVFFTLFGVLLFSLLVFYGLWAYYARQF